MVYECNIPMRGLILSLSKVISIAIEVTASVIDPIFIYCSACGRCLILRSINVHTVAWWHLSSHLLAQFTHQKLSTNLNSVQPVVQLPTISTTVTDKTKEDTATEQNEEETSDTAHWKK